MNERELMAWCDEMEKRVVALYQQAGELRQEMGQKLRANALGLAKEFGIEVGQIYVRYVPTRTGRKLRYWYQVDEIDAWRTGVHHGDKWIELRIRVRGIRKDGTPRDNHEILHISDLVTGDYLRVEAIGQSPQENNDGRDDQD